MSAAASRWERSATKLATALQEVLGAPGQVIAKLPKQGGQTRVARALRLEDLKDLFGRRVHEVWVLAQGGRDQGHHLRLEVGFVTFSEARGLRV